MLSASPGTFYWAFGALAKGKRRAVAPHRLKPVVCSSRFTSSSVPRSDKSAFTTPRLQPQPSQTRRPESPATTFLEPEHLEPKSSPSNASAATRQGDASDMRPTSEPDVSRAAEDIEDRRWGESSSGGSRARAPAAPRAFGEPVVIENPRQLYKGPAEREEQQVPLSWRPEHPFHFLPMRDKLRLDKHRTHKLPSFPEPIKIPAYPQPVFRPSDPTTQDADAPPTLRYKDLPPDNLVELYRERIANRKLGPKETPPDKLTAMFFAEPDDPKGWWLVREKMGLPPDNASRPASVLWYWESLNEAQLWKLIMPLFWLWALFPIVGASSLFAYMVWDGYFIDPYDGSWQWTGRNWERNWAFNWDNLTLRRDLTKFDRPPEIRI